MKDVLLASQLAKLQFVYETMSIAEINSREGVQLDAKIKKLYNQLKKAENKK